MILRRQREPFKSLDDTKDAVERYRIARLLVRLAKYYRFFEEDHGYLGLAPKSTQPGDCISLVYGCDSLLLLRKVCSHYVHAGSCFVLGLMDTNQMAKMLETRDAKLERIEIR
jgi:hypothetical protein